jgi:hypothetical protein
MIQPARLFLLVAAATVVSQSARADDNKACIDASESAVALKMADKLLRAREQLSVCASSRCPSAVKNSCQQRLADVGRAIPSLVLSATDAAGNDLTAVTLSIDGVAYSSRLSGTAIELDPGEHELRLEAVDQPPAVKRFVLRQGERGRRESVVIGSPLPARSPTPSPTVDLVSTHAGNTQRAAGWTVAGVGVAGLAAGSVSGLLAISAHSSYETHCGAAVGAPSGSSCEAPGVSGQKDAATEATASTFFFVAGGVAAAAGLTLLLTAPKRAAAAQLGIAPGGVLVRGQF